MARQAIDTTTDHGTYKGDPAQTAFNKINSNEAELYSRMAATEGVANAALPKAGGTINGQVRFTGTTGRLILDDQSNNSLSWYNWVNNGAYYWVYQGSSVPASISYTGVVTATSFNPTSSADVKDYLQGYAGDADADLDRLVVITYKYRPEFMESDKTYIGFLAENVQSVRPEAAPAGATWVEHVPVLLEDGVPALDERGNPIIDRVVEHVQPRSVDMMQILALSVRAHQQKNRRIKLLEERLAALEARIGDAP